MVEETRDTDELKMHAWDNEGFSHLTACSQRAMCEQAQEQALIMRALQECNGVTQWARGPAPGRIAGTA